MNFQYSRLSEWPLRLGLAAVFIYSSYGLFFNPQDWIGYMPVWFQNLLPVAPESYLKFQALAELACAFSFLTGFLLRWAALVAAAEMLGILLFNGIDAVTFRDMAILGAALSVFLARHESAANN